jgi:sterol-4alpha-carboxylate 3-dehydrogenase (decarboxylating)
LLDHGNYDVTVFDLNESDIPGVVHAIRGDLSALQEVEVACIGRDVVFHVATAAPTASNAATAQALMVKVNVTGTENVIRACKAANVPRLVFTSTASVVFEGKDLIDVNESCPYAARPMDFYTGTKIQVRKTFPFMDGFQNRLGTWCQRKFACTGH